MSHTSTSSLLEGLDEDLKIVQRQSIESHDVGTHEEKLANAALLRLRVSVLEQRIEIVRLLSAPGSGVPTRFVATAAVAFALGWLARGWC
jgi:hypothetical protein